MCFKKEIGFIIVALGIGLLIAAFLPLWMVIIIEALIIIFVGMFFVKHC